MTDTKAKSDDQRSTSHARLVREGKSDAVSVTNISKTYGDGDDAVVAVEDLSFSIESGNIVGFLGPNGAGKTTALKSMLGLVIPDSGRAEVYGNDVETNPKDAYEHIGVLFEGVRNEYWRLSVHQNLKFFAALGGKDPAALRDRHDELISRFDLEDKTDTTVNKLSRGMKQKVSLANALARGTSIVFLDEPTLGLDVESSIKLRGELRRLAKEEDLTIVLSSHNMSVVRDICDRVIILNDGRIVTDSPVDELLDVFDKKSYDITLKQPIPPILETELRNAFEVTEWSSTAETESFRVVLEKNGLYDVTDLLKTHDAELLDIDAAENLEDIFLKITETETNAY